MTHKGMKINLMAEILNHKSLKGNELNIFKVVPEFRVVPESSCHYRIWYLHLSTKSIGRGTSLLVQWLRICLKIPYALKNKARMHNS